LTKLTVELSSFLGKKGAKIICDTISNGNNTKYWGHKLDPINTKKKNQPKGKTKQPQSLKEPNIKSGETVKHQVHNPAHPRTGTKHNCKKDGI